MKFVLTILLATLFACSTFAKTEAKLQTATFAAGCFWGVEHFFRKVPGVMKTQVGYIGGKTKKPAYDDVSEGKTGHAEAVEVQYDPKKVSYEALLDLFFKMHDPTTKDRQGNDIGSQYRSGIFFHGVEQKEQAQKFIQKVEKSKAWKASIVTEVTAAGTFYKAEEEHQNYLIKHPNGYDNHHLRPISFDSTK